MIGASDDVRDRLPNVNINLSKTEKNKLVLKPRRNRDDLAFLPAALEILETPASPAGRAIAMTIVAFTLFAVIWSAIGKVDIVVTSQGRIEPIGDSKTIQPLEAGLISSILVQDNQSVVVGQPLVTLDPVSAAADAKQAAFDLLQARLDHSRLGGLRTTILSEHLPVLIDVPAEASQAQLEATQAAMNAQYTGQLAKLANLDQQIAGQQEKYLEAAATMAQLDATLSYSQQMANVRDKAMTLGVGSKIDWITANQQLSQQQHQVAVLKMQEVEAQSGQDALVAQRSQAVADYETSVLGDLVKANQQIDQYQQALAKAKEQLELTTLRAPISGTVQQLQIHTIGGVVTPAEPLMVIVPSNPKLTADIRIANQDMAFVRVGQTVQLKIAAFDFTRYGTIPGMIIGISHDVEGALPVNQLSSPASGTDQSNKSNADPPSSQQEAQAGSYVAEVELMQTAIATEHGVVQLYPGMQLTADIKTGRRSVMSYMLSPIDTLRRNAMRQ